MPGSGSDKSARSRDALPMPARHTTPRSSSSQRISGSETSFFPGSSVQVADRGRLRFWLLYAAAWIPLVAIYALLIAQPGMPITDAVIGSLTSVVPAALLGAVVVRLTERITDARPGRAQFLLVHALLAILYGAAWCGTIVASMYWGAPRDVFDTFVNEAIGWQFVSGMMLYALIAGITT